MKWSEPRRITSNSGLTFQPTISNDGTLIAYSSDRAGEGNLDIWVQQTAGGTPIQITTDPADDIEPHFSPDSKQIAFRSGRGEGGIYIAPALGGHARLVAPGGHRPRFSPDGRSISYYTGLFVSSPLLPIYPGGDCYVVAAAGGLSTRLAVDAYGAADPVWSPDGSMLLVRTAKKTYDPAGYEWRVVSPDGVDHGATEAVRAIQESPASNVFHVYRPEYWDSDGFVYFCSRDEDNVDLWRIRVDGKSGRAVGLPEQVLAGTGAYYGPAISQGGRLVIADIRVNADVWSLGIDADRGTVLDSQPIRLTDAEGFDTSPAVSLDGSRIVYRSERSGKRETWLLDVASRQERPLLEAIGRPAISASGKRIAVNNQDGQVSLLSVDGSIEKQFSGDFPWDWTPDETLVLFNRLDGDQRAIFLFEIGSGKTTRLIADPGQSFFQGQFSADGRWIAWMAGQSGTIWLAPFRGPEQIPESDWIRISDGSRYSDKPRWSPSGELLYYTRDHEGFTCIYAQPLGRETKQPKGELLEIYHSHNARLSIANIGLPSLEIDVARDKIIFGMAELSGNLWMMEPTH